jgi:hypothetical protein
VTVVTLAEVRSKATLVYLTGARLPATLLEDNRSRLAEKRAFPRRRRRLLVEWAGGGFASAGFTHDVSPSGLFVCSTYIPGIKRLLTLTLSLPSGRKIRLRGMTVRSYRVPANLRRAVPSGFCVRLTEAPEDYFGLLADLFSVRFTDERA